MPFVPPTSNITANYWRRDDWWGSWPGPIVGTETWQFQCQLRATARTTHGLLGQPRQPPWQITTVDNHYYEVPVFATNEWWYWMPVIEAPAGSGFFFLVADTYMVGAGFGNQYLAMDVIASWFLDGSLSSGLAHWPYTPQWSQQNPVSWPS